VIPEQVKENGKKLPDKIDRVTSVIITTISIVIIVIVITLTATIFRTFA
jgi:hypothetical protein